MLRSTCRPIALSAVLLGVALLLAQTTAQSCSVRYQSSGRPLLFGGVNEPGRCQKGCHRVNDYWTSACQFRLGQTWGSCNEQQIAKTLDYAKSLGGGGAFRLSPCDLVRYLRGRTLWLIGDSHTKILYRSLQCFLIDFWQNQEVCEASTDTWAVQALQRLPVAPGDSQCIHLRGSGGGRVCIVQAVLGTQLINNNQVEYGGVLPLLRAKFATRRDVFLVNFSAWHKKQPDWWDAFKPALTSIGEFYQANRRQWPHMLFWETPAKHEVASSGDKCQAANGFRYRRHTGGLELAPAARVNMAAMWSLGIVENRIMRESLSRFSIPLLPSINMTVSLEEAHVGGAMNSNFDCLHYCSPGVPEMWIWNLYDAFKNGRTGIRALQPSGKGAGRFTCIKSHTASFRI